MNSEIIKYLIPGIIGLLGVLIGSLLSFWTNYVIKSKETALRIREKVFDRKIKAYEDLLSLCQEIRVTNVVTLNEDDKLFNKYPSSLLNQQSLKKFAREYNEIANRCAFWVDIEVVRSLHFFKDYLNELVFILKDIPEANYINVGVIIKKDFLKFAFDLEQKLTIFFEKDVEKPTIKTRRGHFKFDKEVINKMMLNTEFKKNEQEILNFK